MRIAVTGSIATDHLMVYPGRFTEHFLSDHLDTVSLSFLVDDLEVRRGGVAANISFGLAQLGVSPTLVGAVGKDFDDYRAWLIGHGVDTRFVRVSPTRHTSRFLCTTDQDQNQIASFYSGAMDESRFIELGPLVEDLPRPLDLGRSEDGARHREAPHAHPPPGRLAALEPRQTLSGTASLNLRPRRGPRDDWGRLRCCRVAYGRCLVGRQSTHT